MSISKRKKIFIAILITMVMVIGMIPLSVTAAEPDERPGELILDKTATPGLSTDPDNDIWEWEITLTLRGLDLITTSDIVLLVDVSGSMLENNRLVAAKAAAKKFIADLITNGNGGTRIAIIPYSSFSMGGSGFATFFGEDPGDDVKLNAAVDSLVASGGTNTQHGIKTARDLLEDSVATNQYIVLLSDGDPTYSGTITAVSGIEAIQASSSSGDYFDHWKIAEDYSITYDYGSRVGNGNSFTSGVSTIGIEGDLDNTVYSFPSSTNINTDPLGIQPAVAANHGYPTKYDAKLAKKEGIEFYSVGVGGALSDDGQRVLQDCSSGPGYYFTVPDSDKTDNLVYVLTQIAGKISFAASSAVVTDPMGDYFTMVKPDGSGTAGDGSDIVVSQGSIGGIAVDPVTGKQTITWNVGDVRQVDGIISMKYTIRIDVSQTTESELYPTNEYTYVDFRDIYGYDSSKPFPIPMVGYPQVGSVTAYYYILNSAGEPTTLQGFPTDDRDLINFASTKAVTRGMLGDTVNPNNIAIPYNTPNNPAYSLTAEPFIVLSDGVSYYFVQGNSTNLGDQSPKNDIVVDKDNESVRVYFAYKLPDYNLIYDSNDGTNRTDVNPVINNQAYTVKGNVFPRTDYAFTRWNTKADGTGTDYMPGSSITIRNSDVVLYAQWQQRPGNWVTVTFVNGNPDKGTLTGTLVFGGVIGDSASNIVEPEKTPARGYKFAGWDKAIPTIYPQADMTITGNWEIIEYNITYEVGEGTNDPDNPKTYTIEDTPLTLKNPTRPGYTFGGWTVTYGGIELINGNTIPAGTIGDLTLTAKWTPTGGGYTDGGTPIIDEPPPLADLDIVNHFAYLIGYEDDTVRPQNDITRAEVSTVFFRLLTIESRAELWRKTNKFPDVADSNWHNNAISTLSYGHVLLGYPDGTFRPDATITRAELAAISVRFQYNGELSSYPPGLTGFSDIEGHWAENYIKMANQLGYVNGYPDGTFKPNAPITRAEFATLLNNVLNRHVESKADTRSGMKTWSDNPESVWYYLTIQEATNSHYFDRKSDGLNEVWTEIRPNPNWSALEKTYSNSNDITY